MSNTGNSSSVVHAEPIIFPINLRCNIKEIQIASDLRLVQLTHKEMELSANIHGLATLTRGASPELIENINFFGSNYALFSPSRDRAEQFNFAIKLIAVSGSALYMGHTANGGRYFIQPCFYSGERLRVIKATAKKLVELQAILDTRWHDKRIAILRDIFLHALSTKLRRQSRFLEFCIILEMLLVPNNNGETVYRFSNRLAHLIHKLWKKDKEETFSLGKQIYDMRSKLAHSGEAKNIDQFLPVVCDLARALLLEYVKRPEIFDDKQMNKMCLGV